MHSLQLFVDSKFTSPYAMSAFVALTEKKLSFELSTIDLSKNAHQQENYTQISLTSRVPTLIHNGFSLSESSAIDEYIDEVFEGIALYPTKPQDKARARQIQAWLRSDLMSIREERSTGVIFYKPSPIALSASAQESAKKLFFIADTLLREDSKNIFDDWSIVDVDLALMLNRLILNGDSVPEKLAAYAKHQWQRPSVQAWVNKKRP